MDLNIQRGMINNDISNELIRQKEEMKTIEKAIP